MTCFGAGCCCSEDASRPSMARYAWTSLSTQSSEQQHPAPNHSYVILSLSEGKEKTAARLTLGTYCSIFLIFLLLLNSPTHSGPWMALKRPLNCTSPPVLARIQNTRLPNVRFGVIAYIEFLKSTYFCEEPKLFHSLLLF